MIQAIQKQAKNDQYSCKTKIGPPILIQTKNTERTKGEADKLNLNLSIFFLPWNSVPHIFSDRVTDED